MQGDSKTELDVRTAELQVCQAAEAEAAGQLRNDRAKLSELQDRIAVRIGGFVEQNEPALSLMHDRALRGAARESGRAELGEGGRRRSQREDHRADRHIVRKEV